MARVRGLVEAKNRDELKPRSICVYILVISQENPKLSLSLQKRRTAGFLFEAVGVKALRRYSRFLAENSVFAAEA
jgi:hypothetical protein